MAERGEGGRFLPKVPGTEPAPDPAPAAPPKDPGTESITSSLIGSMSGPNHVAISAVTAREGRPEPEIATEPPKRGRGRPKGATTRKSRISGLAGDPKAAAAQAAPMPAEDQIEISQRMSAATAAQMTIMTGMIIGGEDFAPRKNELANVNDTEMLTEAYFNYFKAKNMPELPPGLALFCAVMCYVAPRLAQPTTQSRVKVFFTKVTGFFKRIFTRRKNAAQPDRRDDGERKVDTQQEAQS